MIVGYDSVKEEVTKVCGNCSKNEVISLDQFQMYASFGPGVYLRAPVCSGCSKAVEILYSAGGQSNAGSHALNCAAFKAFEVCEVVPDEMRNIDVDAMRSLCKKKLDAIELRYEDGEAKDQLFGNQTIVWSAN